MPLCLTHAYAMYALVVSGVVIHLPLHTEASYSLACYREHLLCAEAAWAVAALLRELHPEARVDCKQELQQP